MARKYIFVNISVTLLVISTVLVSQSVQISKSPIDALPYSENTKKCYKAMGSYFKHIALNKGTKETFKKLINELKAGPKGNKESILEEKSKLLKSQEY